MSAFITAVKRGNIEEIEQFLTYNGSRQLVNQQDSRTHESALYCACVKGDLVLASCLLAHQASVDLKTKWKATALHAASHAGHENLVRLLLRNNSGLNEQTHHGDTALHLASSGNHLGVVKVLVEAGTDVTLLNSRGRNAIQEAEREGSDLVVTYFNKLFYEGNNGKNNSAVSVSRIVPRLTQHNYQYRRPQENMTCYRSNSEPSKKSNSWLYDISNSEYEFLGLPENENDLSVSTGKSASVDPSKELNIQPTSSDQNRLKYLEETIGTLLTDYKRTKDELKHIQSELNETRKWLKTCNSCHHCARYRGQPEVDDTTELRRYNFPETGPITTRRNVRFEEQS